MACVLPGRVRFFHVTPPSTLLKGPKSVAAYTGDTARASGLRAASVQSRIYQECFMVAFSFEGRQDSVVANACRGEGDIQTGGRKRGVKRIRGAETSAAGRQAEQDVRG